MPHHETFFNLASSAIVQHTFACGISQRMNNFLTGSITYAHAFHNTISGRFETPLGPAPGTNITIDQSIHTLLIGVHANY